MSLTFLTRSAAETESKMTSVERIMNYSEETPQEITDGMVSAPEGIFMFMFVCFMFMFVCFVFVFSVLKLCWKNYELFKCLFVLCLYFRFLNLKIIHFCLFSMFKKTGWPAEGRINWKKTVMRYRPELPFVLNNVSFKVNKHEWMKTNMNEWKHEWMKNKLEYKNKNQHNE